MQKSGSRSGNSIAMFIDFSLSLMISTSCSFSLSTTLCPLESQVSLEFCLAARLRQDLICLTSWTTSHQSVFHFAECVGNFYPLTDLLTIFINYGFMVLKFYIVVQSLSSFQLFAAPQTIARQAPLSLGFPRQEYWSGLPFSSPVTWNLSLF